MFFVVALERQHVFGCMDAGAKQLETIAGMVLLFNFGLLLCSQHPVELLSGTRARSDLAEDIGEVILALVHKTEIFVLH